MGFWNEFVPEQYKQYVTDATSLKAFVKARDSGDMSAWEASVNYTPPPPVVEQNAAGVKPDPEAVTEIPGTKKVSQPGSSDQFDPNYKPSFDFHEDMQNNFTNDGKGVVQEVKEVPHSLLEAATTSEIGDFELPSLLDEESRKYLGMGNEQNKNNDGKGVVQEVATQLAETGTASDDDKFDGKTGRVTQLQDYAKTMTGIEGRTPGIINAAGSTTIEGLSRLGKGIDEVQAGFSKFRENVKGRVASAESALKGEVGWGSHSSEYDQFKSDLQASGLDEETIRRGKAHSEGQDAEDVGRVEVGQEDKKKLESDAAHQKYKSDMIAQGGAIGADAFKGGGGKAVSFNRMGQY
jgi:hypothetical protein|tara:strand:- start:83 stop:1132 length:1050 start_codon:yes stop_codon:yes gene_type:complete